MRLALALLIISAMAAALFAAALLRSRPRPLDNAAGEGGDDPRLAEIFNEGRK